MLFQKKLDKCFEIFQKGLDTMENPYLALSWGKDSVFMLWIRQELRAFQVPCVFMNSGYQLPDIYLYRDKLLKEWNIQNYIEIDESYDFSKHKMAHNRSSAEQKVFVKFLKKDTADKYLVKNGHDGCFLGLRASEKGGRDWLMKKSKGLLKTKKGIFRCYPLAFLSDAELFYFYRKFKIPLCDIYKKTKFVDEKFLRSNGWESTDGAQRGRIAWLKYYYPKYFYKLYEIFPEIRGYT